MSIEHITLIEEPAARLPTNITGRVLAAAGSLFVEAVVVVGMRLRYQPDMLMSGYTLSQQEARRRVELRASHARRWAEFFRQHMAVGTDHTHNSEEIVRYVLGTDSAAIHRGRPLPPLKYRATDPRRLEAGKGYGILDRHGAAMNLVYGINDPRLCLGTLGIGQPLFVATTAGMMDLHQSQSLGEVVANHGSLYP